MALVAERMRPAAARRTLSTRVAAALPERGLESTCALVLAGGRGARLHQLTDARAKPVVPFAGTLKIIDFTLSNCINSGIRRVKVLTQYKAQGLIRHVASAWSFLDAARGEGIEVVPAQQQQGECWYRGTADAVHQNTEMLREGDPEFALVLAGDHVYKMDYARLVAEHARRDADVTIACVEVPLEQASALGVVDADADGRVLEFIEKPACPVPRAGRSGTVLASMGIYVFRAALLWRELARDAADPDSRHDFGGDILPALVARSRVFAHDFACSCVGKQGAAPYWRDVGTLDAYLAAHLDLLRSTPELDLGNPAWPIRGQALQLPGARFSSGPTERCASVVDSLVCGGSVIEAATLRRALLAPHVHVGAGSLVEDAVLLPGARVGRNVVLRRAIVDEGCAVPDGLTIGVHPDEDAARFTVTAAGVTLVTARMLARHR